MSDQIVLEAEAEQTEQLKHLTLLNFDHTLTLQHTLQKFPHHWIDCSDILHTYGYCEARSLDQIRKRFKKQKISPFVFIGSGNYHYVSYLLLEKIPVPFSLILFDHHSDMMKKTFEISCGSWVKFAIDDLELLRKVVIIGVNEEEYAACGKLPEHEKILIITKNRVERSPLNHLIEDIRMFLPMKENIYISVDKDVLHSDEVITNWDQGTMSFVQLLFIIRELIGHYRLLGMNVCGEFVENGSNQYQPETMDKIKMNEIVNCTLAYYATQIT